MKHLDWFALCLSMSMLVGCGVSVETPQIVTPVVASPTPPTTTTATLEVQIPTQTIFPTAELKIVSTDIPTKSVLLDIVECKNTFCPPYMLTQQTAPMLQFPGIIFGEALNELRVLISYDPTLYTEEEVVQLFIDVTGFDVEVASDED